MKGYDMRKLKKALLQPPAPPKASASGGKGKKSAKGKWLEAVSTLNEILLDPSADLRSGVNAVNEMLTVIENVLLEGFFKEYEDWLQTQSEGKQNPMPQSLVEKGEKVHKLILSRGKFIITLLGKIKENQSEEQETSLSSSLFQTPDWMEIDDAEDDNWEVQI